LATATTVRPPTPTPRRLYEKLEHTVLPLYYERSGDWLAVMRGAIAKNAAFFNSHRMMRRYAAEAYIR
jgi:glycogen phosphorylase